MKHQHNLGTRSLSRFLPHACVVILLGASALSVTAAGNPNPGILRPNSKPHGEWAAAWWQWALSIPEAQNPVADTTGEFSGVGQSGPVWFLAGTFGTSAERTVTVPRGKSIFMPVHNWIFGSGVFDCDPTNPGVPCDVPTLRAAAAAAATGAEVVEAWIDGVQVNNIRDYRAISPEPFSVTFPEERSSESRRAPTILKSPTAIG